MCHDPEKERPWHIQNTSSSSGGLEMLFFRAFEELEEGKVSDWGRAAHSLWDPATKIAPRCSTQHLISATAKQRVGNHREGWKLPGQTLLSHLSHKRCICLQMNHQDGVHSLHFKSARWAVELVKAGARYQSLQLEPAPEPPREWQTLNRTL